MGIKYMLGTAVLAVVMPSSLLADVYRCVGLTDDVVFQDFPCESVLERQEILPYEYQATQAKVVREEEKKAREINKRFESAKKTLIREQAREEKRAEKEARKQERLAERCEKAQEKIKIADEELRSGCTIARCRQLKAEVSRYEKVEKRYCRLE